MRRAALAVIRLLVENGLRFRIDTAHGLLDFFADRMKVQQREAGVRHDLIDAVIALGTENDLVRLLARVRALQSFVTTEDGANLLAAYKRAANILKAAADAAPVAAGSDLLPAESALLVALEAAEPKADAAVESEQFEAAMAALASVTVDRNDGHCAPSGTARMASGALAAMAFTWAVGGSLAAASPLACSVCASATATSSRSGCSRAMLFRTT